MITGWPGVGKTTLVQHVVRGLNIPPGGFVTREIREQGKRIGFEIEALTPGLTRSRGTLARVGLKSRGRVGRYGVNIEDLEEVGAAALERAREISDLIVIDEIGNMELVSRRFQKAVISCLDSSTPVLGVIKASKGPFVDRIKARPDVEVIKLTRDNFDAIKERVTDIVNALLK